MGRNVVTETGLGASACEHASDAGTLKLDAGSPKLDAGASKLDAFSPDLEIPPEVFVQRLEPYERVLLSLKNHLYEGSWERIVEDLRARLEEKPYIYKLSKTITRDLAAVERMKAYEARQKVNLSALVKK